MRRWYFFIREGFSTLSRSGLAGWLTILAFAVLAGMLSFASSTRTILDRVQSSLLSRFEIEAFLIPGTEDEPAELMDWLRGREGVSRIRFISREEAAKRFSRYYGEELFDLLGENPLPASILIGYDPAQMTPELLEQEAKIIGNREEVDEVNFEGQLLVTFEKTARWITRRLIVIGVLILVVSLWLMMITVRVAARMSRRWVRAVSLVGGSLPDVRVPFILSGVLTGFLGGIIGTTIVICVHYWLSRSESMVPQPNWLPFVFILAGTTLLGALTAVLSAPRAGSSLDLS